ncbi:hypothetical protein FRC14_002610 [Serendipita sp. 396]|nr:hypothetical protein FRC14_002610 [Serendipita sp. 396]KAG8784433.1 hypothetical protein FRC15_003280 [Serendipita sp. 397]KAG8871330.1 hypothetical protein FRC20_010684 [Serendipita sp. 405]
MTARGVRLVSQGISLVHRHFFRRFSSFDNRAAFSNAWAPVHETGRYPLYDMALQIIKGDSKERLEELDCLRREGAASTQPSRLEQLEILAEMNKPEIIWAFRHGKADMAKPVFRHLAKREWRERGRLDRLMERIHTMNVVPDLLPDLHPSIDLSLAFGPDEVEPGVFVDPILTVQPPRIRVNAFHGDERYYTLVMVDLDVPDPARQSFRQCLHWLIPNIVISSKSSSLVHLPATQEGYNYLPPHPQIGTPYHRYCLLLLENPNPHLAIDLRSMLETKRIAFSLRDFIKAWSFRPEAGGGAFFWRSVWSPAVTDIYRDILRVPEPRYGRPPKEDRYEDVKRTRRYI